jgi:hypothetical protein
MEAQANNVPEANRTSRRDGGWNNGMIISAEIPAP